MTSGGPTRPSRTSSPRKNNRPYRERLFAYPQLEADCEKRDVMSSLSRHLARGSKLNIRSYFPTRYVSTSST